MTLRYHTAPLLSVAMATAVLPAIAQQLNWARYNQPTGLSAEFPGEPERFDKWTPYAQGRVIQLEHTGRNTRGDFRSLYFLQAVIADKPYNVDAEIARAIAELKDGGDAAVSRTYITHRALKPTEMPLPGMRGVELVYRYGIMGSDPQITVDRRMYVGNKWLAISVRHFEADKGWPRDRFFNSVRWAP